MKLSDLFEETVTGTPPPSRWSAEQAFREGRRRRRVGLAVRATLVALPIVALLAMLAAVVPFRGNEVADLPPSRWVVHKVGGFTEKRLWAYVEPCAGCGFELRTSENGGRTWDGLVVSRSELDLRILGTASGGLALIEEPTSVRVGRNGWGVLQAVPFVAAPVLDPPPDSPVHCVFDERADTGTVRVIDIPGGRYGYARTQPPFPCQATVRLPGGLIVAAGEDPATAQPAFARSSDDGATWEVAIRNLQEPQIAGEKLVIEDILTSASGGAVVMVRYGASSVYYRFDSGTWARIQPPAGSPNHLVLTRDDTLIAQTTDITLPGGPPSPGPSATPLEARTAFTANRPGETGFHPVARPAGIARQPILGSSVLPGGGYVAFNSSHIWTSSDAKTWKAVPLG
jgi:hypothetical protein